MEKTLVKLDSSVDSISLEPSYDLEQIWSSSLELIAKEIKKPSFEIWIKNSKLVLIQDNYATIAVKNEFTRNFLSQTYHHLIHKNLQEVVAKNLGLRFVVDASIEIEEPKISVQESLASIPEIKKNMLISRLIPEFVFENFVVNNSNFTAHAFTKVLLMEETHYRSLIIFADTGLGKTHLLNAFGNSANALGKRVCYTSAENFTNEFIMAIQRNQIQEFKNKYRNLDYLIVDEIAFLDNKKACQEELAYTFEAIAARGGKIIVSSSKPLDQFKNFNKKLSSLLSGSLIANITNPSFEDRVQFLKAKTQALSEDQIAILAAKFVLNIRELESALSQLTAYASFTKSNIDDACIANLFGAITHKPKYSGLDAQMILDEVADYFALDFEELTGKSRKSHIVKARHLAVYLMHEFLQISYTRIGSFFSMRKHSSILHSIDFVRTSLKGDLPSDKFLQSAYSDIKKKF